MKLKILSLLLFSVSVTYSQIVDVNFPGGGTKSYSAWSNINSFNYTGYGSFPGNAPWPAPIRATQGSTNSTLNRMAGSPTGGGPFLASESIYFGNFAQVPNALGGTLRISNSSGITNLRTLLFQIQIGEATGYDFFSPTGFPKLTLNGITYNATFTNLVNRFQNGVFPSPETGKDEPVYINTWAYQYNLTNNGFANYHIDFSGVTHSQVYAMRWDGTSVLQGQVIPEPSTLGLLTLAAAGVAGYIIRKRKRF
jgi:hypothetical protein